MHVLCTEGLAVRSDATRAMRADVAREAQILAVKRTVLRTLEALATDAERRRVIGAVGVLLGEAEAVWTERAPWRS